MKVKIRKKSIPSPYVVDLKQASFSPEEPCMFSDIRKPQKRERPTFKAILEIAPRLEEPETRQVPKPVWELEIKPKKIKPQVIPLSLKHPWLSLKSLFQNICLGFRAYLRFKNWQLKLSFLFSAFLVALIIPALSQLNQGLALKAQVAELGSEAFANLISAQTSLKNQDFRQAQLSFQNSYQNFVQAQIEIASLGKLALVLLNQATSGQSLIKLGSEISQMGSLFIQALAAFEDWHFGDIFEKNPALSLTDRLTIFQENLQKAQIKIEQIQQTLTKIKPSTLPASVRPQFKRLAQKIPLIHSLLIKAQEAGDFLIRALGHSNPKRYLIIFQNSSEIRPTGGFIGTYGLIDFNEGQITKLKIEGIYHIDGQLRVNVIPPKPLQKISTAWSTHDANWFFDFPTSAQKIAWFFEKTGSGSVDGVIAVTPEVLESLLGLTGPIDMPKYGIRVTSKNFIDILQYKIEVDYDKALNRPKQILADLTPSLLERLSKLPSEKKPQLLEILYQALTQKQIQFFSFDREEENFILKQGWGGQILKTNQDYLAVVNTNLNGFKTDKVINQEINLKTEITPKGEIINSLTITRAHQGGTTPYDWYNRVNSNYLRVYVPLGSKLLQARGHTLENRQPPLDYQKNAFQADPLVEKIEKNLKIDPGSGTHIFEETGKTVFGNWVYVSPGEKVKVFYQYLLPFKLSLDPETSPSFSLIFQKQPGMKKQTLLNYQISWPLDWRISWYYPEKIFSLKKGQITFKENLDQDKFFGLILSRK